MDTRFLQKGLLETLCQRAKIFGAGASLVVGGYQMMQHSYNPHAVPHRHTDSFLADPSPKSEFEWPLMLPGTLLFVGGFTVMAYASCPYRRTVEIL